MITLDEFRSMKEKDQSNYLFNNFKATKKSRSFRKKILGIGINDADYITGVLIDGAMVRCPAYESWRRMLHRAHSDNFKKTRPTYIGVTSCEEWNSFLCFRNWWLKNSVDGWHLDKDILSENRTYSPENCIFVPQWINVITSDAFGNRGEFKIGSSWSHRLKKFTAQCNHPFSKKKHIGVFDSEDDAYNAWLSRKLEIALELKPKMDEIDERIYHGVVRIIKNAR